LLLTETDDDTGHQISVTATVLSHMLVSLFALDTLWQHSSFRKHAVSVIQKHVSATAAVFHAIFQCFSVTLSDPKTSKFDKIT
jgi:hypothetical protein